jgi:N-sulfoglucosamine sulfohydrolase
VKKYFDLAFARRPAEELYDLGKDPEQLVNVAGKPEYARVQRELSERLTAGLKATRDPRVVGGAEKFDRYPYYGSPQKPAPQK